MNGLGDHEKRLAEQLAAAQAVIAEARSLHGNHPDDWAGSCLLCKALSQSPTDALQAHDAVKDQQIAELTERMRKAHDKLVWLAVDLGWATDGRLETGVRHVTELVGRLRERAEVAEAKIAAALAYLDTWSPGRMSPNIAALRAALTATETTNGDSGWRT